VENAKLKRINQMQPAEGAQCAVNIAGQRDLGRSGVGKKFTL